MDISANLSTLDQNSIVGISSFLDYHDILKLTTSARSFSFLADHQAVWKSQISNYIAIDLIYFDEDFPSMNPKEQFKFLVGKVTRICDLLANIIHKFDPAYNAKSILQKDFMEDFENKAQIDKIIKEEYEKLPLDYYVLYRLLNGEQLIKSKPKEVALFGGFTYYNSAYQFNFLPLSKPENDPIIQKYKLLTLTKDPYSGVRLFVDTNNFFKQGYGSIFMLSSLRQENGKRIIRGFIFKPNIMRFLEDLQYISYNQEEEILEHFDSLERPLSDVTTRGIRIRTSAIFNPWDRQHGGYLFVYQIRISPNGVQGRWKLTDRHWIIDDNGTPHEVKGPGVIGYHPEVYGGCEEFTYQSCTPMHGFQGTMKGELYFRNMDTGEEIPAIVGEMKLKLPEGCPMIDFYPEDGEVRVVET